METKVGDPDCRHVIVESVGKWLYGKCLIVAEERQDIESRTGCRLRQYPRFINKNAQHSLVLWHVLYTKAAGIASRHLRRRTSSASRRPRS